MKTIHVVCLASLAAVAAVGLALLSSAADGQTGPRVSPPDRNLEAVSVPQGTLHVPSSFRADYELLGSGARAADKGVGSTQLPNVYASRGAIATYHRIGH